MRHPRYLPKKLSNLKLVMLIARSSNNLALQKSIINERMLIIDVNNVSMVNAKEQYSHNTSVARILLWRRVRMTSHLTTHCTQELIQKVLLGGM